MKSDHPSVFNFDNSYTKLPERFFSRVTPDKSKRPEMILFNHELAEELNIDDSNPELLTQILSGNKKAVGSDPIATAYAGHQFGYFTMLGDGRAILLGEHIDQIKKRFDIQIKGAGRTPYSRGGDGKATLKAMLKEYVYSEAMNGLGIPTSRSLAVLKTGENVYRERTEDGAVLCRVMPSHLRVGTFEFARFYGTKEELQQLCDYTIKRHFSEIPDDAEDKALLLFEKVMHRQIDLVINWMRVGFIHGVMNTDNTSICGDSFDYGPCAFMGVYDPKTVFSSIDENGRYAFGNQPSILKWNLSRFAEALLPLIDDDLDKAVEIATEKVNEFDSIFDMRFDEMMLSKIGIDEPEKGDIELAEEFLKLIKIHKKDYTHSFNSLRLPDLYRDKAFVLGVEFLDWKKRWTERISRGAGKGHSFSIMERYNPLFIPRNYFVEEALDLAVEGELKKLKTLIYNLQMPYWYDTEMDNSLFEPIGFDQNYQTFCGT